MDGGTNGVKEDLLLTHKIKKKAYYYIYLESVVCITERRELITLEEV